VLKNSPTTTVRLAVNPELPRAEPPTATTRKTHTVRPWREPKPTPVRRAEHIRCPPAEIPEADTRQCLRATTFRSAEPDCIAVAEHTVRRGRTRPVRGNRNPLVQPGNHNVAVGGTDNDNKTIHDHVRAPVRFKTLPNPSKAQFQLNQWLSQD